MKLKKTRKSSPDSVSNLVDQTSFLHQIALKSEIINRAQQSLQEINIPLLKNFHILNFENAHLLLGTENQSTLARFYMQRSDILRTLRQHRAFGDLLSVKAQIFITPITDKDRLIPKKRDDIPDTLSSDITDKLSKLCHETKLDNLKAALTKLLAKHGKF